MGRAGRVENIPLKDKLMRDLVSKICIFFKENNQVQEGGSMDKSTCYASMLTWIWMHSTYIKS